LRLVINEALDSFHSLAIEGSAFTDGAYYDWHALAPLLAGDGRRIAGCTALSIGDAAGSLRRVYAAVHPGVSVDAVDLDGATMKLGERFFPGPKAEGQSAVVDGRVFIARSKRTWHVIHVDAYAHQIYVPAHLASREFFAAVKARLAPGGVIALNVGALEPGDAVLRAIAATLASEFGHAKALLVPNSRNALLVARAGQPLAPALLAAFAFGAERLNANDQEHWRAIVKRAAEPDAWIDLGQAGTVLDDDRPVLDRLLSESYLSREDDGAVLPCRGAVRTEGAEIAAYGARVARDWRAVLRAVESSSAPSAYLRELAGDARWALRQMRCAIAEYEAGVALSEAPESTKRLQERLVQAQEQARPIELAARAAQRNGWLQFGIVVAATVLLFVCWRWRDGSAA
jgi:spermidine synthase